LRDTEAAGTVRFCIVRNLPGEVSQMKSMTLRLSDDIAAELDAVARVDGTTVADQVRSAIEDRIAARRADKGFQARRRKALEENKAALERLAR
jgi:predicted transcriptional regulator